MDSVLKYLPLVFASIFSLWLIIYLFSRFTIVDQWERVPVLLFGRYIGALEPGLKWLPPFHKAYDRVTINHQTVPVLINSVQTHDNIPVSFNTVLTFCVDPSRIEDYTVKVTDPDKAMLQRMLGVVTECIGQTELDGILHNRPALCESIKTLLADRVSEWGIIILAIELKDIKIADPAIEQAIAMKARAKKEAEAELVRAEMQQQITHQLNGAATLLTPEGWKLKNLEVLLELGRSGNNNTIMLPADMLNLLAGGLKQ